VHGTSSRRFLAVAFCYAMADVNLAVALPLWLQHEPGGARLVGALLALVLVAMAAAALLSSLLPQRVLARGNLLVLALALFVVGHTAVVVAPGVPTLALAALLDGLGGGLFWVGSQRILGHLSGRAGSEQGFLANYLLVLVGDATSAALTGLFIKVAQSAGVGEQASAAAAFAIGALAALAGLALWFPARRSVESGPVRRGAGLRRPVRGARFQGPDLAITAAISLLVPLAPVVLSEAFTFSPFAIGAVLCAVALGKLTGVTAAEALGRRLGYRRTVVAFLAVAAVALASLSLIPGPAAYVTATVLTAILGAGGWPVVVDHGLAHLPAAERSGLTTAWTARQYGVMAAGTAASGWIAASVSEPRTLVALAAAAMVAAALGATALMRSRLAA
jgi:MFS family permease